MKAKTILKNQFQNLLEPLFQPIQDINGKTYAFESLLRFRGYADNSPLPMVRRWEKTGFINIIDIAMLDSIRSAVQAAAWQPALAVNVSIATIERDGNGYLAELHRLARHSRRLIVELTETAPITNASAVLRFAAACRANNFVIALDDCSPGHPDGTDAFLGTLRPELVKIDGEFLMKSFNSGDVDELRQLIDTAHRFKALVIAEHVSSPDVHQFALFLGVNYVQGYAVGMPAPLPHRDSLPASVHLQPTYV